MSAEGHVFGQEAMIERVRELCRRDERLVAAMMYGSFAQGEGDEFSDLDFILFFGDDALESVNQEEWVSGIAPVELYFVNEYGIGTAIFENLIRGEFHFDAESDIAKIDESWQETDWFPSIEAALVLDRTGELTRRLEKIAGPTLDRDTPEQARFLCASFVNWFVFGANLLARGEFARSLDLLGLVQDQLLRMARILEGSTDHWFNPKKLLEGDVPEDTYERYAACTASLKPSALRGAYLSSWEWGREMMLSLSERHEATLSETLLSELDGRVAALTVER